MQQTTYLYDETFPFRFLHSTILYSVLSPLVFNQKLKNLSSLYFISAGYFLVHVHNTFSFYILFIYLSYILTVLKIVYNNQSTYNLNN